MGIRLNRGVAALLVTLSVGVAGSAWGATKYQCGEGRPSLDAKRCVCPQGQSEATDREGVSRCVVAAPKPTSTATTAPTGSVRAPVPSASAIPCPAGARVVEGVCVRTATCPPGTKQVEDRCEREATCPPGTRAEGASCVAEVVCPTGSTRTPEGTCAAATVASASASTSSSARGGARPSGGSGRCPEGMVLVGATDGAGVAAAALVVLGALLALSRSRRGALAALALGVGCAETPQVRAPQAPLGAYCMDRTEVTIEAFAKCVEAGACSRPDGYDDSLRSTKHQCNWERDEHGSHPVNCIDWEQAATFCAWKGWRLPSADEWQWAARGGARASNFPWGNAAVEGRACFHRRDGSCPVATFPRGASADGIQDLAGNVSEWVSDGEEGAPSRQAYGGSWFDDDGTELRSDAVRTKPGRYRSFSIGFRCAVGAR